MECGRKFGNQVGDPIAQQPYDIRGVATAQGYAVEDLALTGVWAGHVIGYINQGRAGSWPTDPFIMRAPAGDRHFFEFFAAGPLNPDENLARYLRSVPGERVQLDFKRAHVDQSKFRIYYTAGLTGTPDVLRKTLRTIDRVTGTQTAAEFQYLSDKLGAGGHSHWIVPVDVAGNENTGCPVLTATLAPWPEPPTGVEVHAYSAADGMVTVKWFPPSDVSATGSTINAYHNSGADQRVMYATLHKSVPTPFVSTGSPSKHYATLQLPATGAAAAGAWAVGLRHLHGGIEEDNFSALVRFVLADSGAWYGGAPRAPGRVEVEQAPAGRLVVRMTHNSVGEGAEALRFWVYKSPGGSTAVDYSATIGTIPRSNVRDFVGTLGVSGLTDGTLYGFSVRAVASGGVLESNTAVATGTADATPPTSCPTAVTLSKVL